MEENCKFIVSVDDGFCEWSYELELPNNVCISEVVESLCLSFGIQKPEGTCRRGYTLTPK